MRGARPGRLTGFARRDGRGPRRRFVRGGRTSRQNRGLVLEERDGFGGVVGTPAGEHGLQPVLQAVTAALQELDCSLGWWQLAAGDPFQQGFHGVAQVAEIGQAGHAGAALEGVQFPLQ